MDFNEFFDEEDSELLPSDVKEMKHRMEMAYITRDELSPEAQIEVIMRRVKVLEDEVDRLRRSQEKLVRHIVKEEERKNLTFFQSMVHRISSRFDK